MITNLREDLFLFVEDEQGPVDAPLRPSTLLGWVADSTGRVFPITPITGIVQGGWSCFDGQLELAYGRTKEDSRIHPEHIQAWIEEHFDAELDVVETAKRRGTLQ
jgi:hypothetical protein